jgi:hypothetical protein
VRKEEMDHKEEKRRKKKYIAHLKHGALILCV